MHFHKKQARFTHMIALLILHAEQLGYELTFGDAYRDPRVKYGHKNSLHRKRLAVDFNLFKDDVYYTATIYYLELGLYWESIGGTWGGEFNVGGHFSLEHEGMK